MQVQAVGDLRTLLFPTGGPGYAFALYGATIQRLEFRPLSGRIVFVRSSSGIAQVFTANPDGSDQKRLTSGGSAKSGPRFSSDGTKIAYASGGNLYFMNADGSGNYPFPIVDSEPKENRDPCWEGTYRVFFSGLDSCGKRDLWAVYPYGTVERITTSNLGACAPDVF